MNTMLDESNIKVNQFEHSFDYSNVMNLLSARIERVLKEMGWTNADLARAAGSRRAAPTEWRKDKVKNMSSVYAAAIAERSPFHATWIATGDGPIYKGEPAQAPVDRWPFENFSRDRFEALPDRIKGRVEQAALNVIEDYERNKSDDPGDREVA